MIVTCTSAGRASAPEEMTAEHTLEGLGGR
jgi:hypothetical protein